MRTGVWRSHLEYPLLNHPVERDKVVDGTRKSLDPICPLAPSVLPINWGQLTGPVPFSPQTSVAPSLQTKVTPLKQNRSTERIQDYRNQRMDGEDTEIQSAGQFSSTVITQQTLSVSSWQSGSEERNTSSSDGSEEVEDCGGLEIRNSSDEVQGKQVCHGGSETEASKRTDGVLLRSGRVCDAESGTGRCPKDESPLPRSLPPLPTFSSVTSSVSIESSHTQFTSSRHWAPPKGFWRVARPETLVINGLDPQVASSSLPLKDHTQTESGAKPQETLKQPERGTTSLVMQGRDASMDGTSGQQMYEQKYEQRGAQLNNRVKGLSQANGLESISLQAEDIWASEAKVKKNTQPKDTQENSKEEREEGGLYHETTYKVDCTLLGARRGFDDISDPTIFCKEREPCSRSPILLEGELPLSPRHQQAKQILEQVRLKARSCRMRGDQSCRDLVHPIKTQSEPAHPTTAEKETQTNGELAAPAIYLPPTQPIHADSCSGDQGGHPRPLGSSPTRVRFEDESEKEAESRYLDRVRQRNRPQHRKCKVKGNKTDSAGSESWQSPKNIPMPQLRLEDKCGGKETKMVVKEIIVLVKKCEACGSVVKETQSTSVCPQNNKPQQLSSLESPQEKDRDSAKGWTPSGFGKLRRRSRKGESRLECGHGPYGASWAQRRNSNPRGRVIGARAVSFAPGSPMPSGPHLLEISGGLRDTPSPLLPIKSALKSNVRSRGTLIQSDAVQCQVTPNQHEEVGPQCFAPLDSTDSPASLLPGLPTAAGVVPRIKASARYSAARINPDLLLDDHWEHWDPPADGAGLSGELGQTPECRSSLRNLAVSRADDLRQELLRAEHLKAEAVWEERSRRPGVERDGRPKLSLRRFFSSIGLNSVGRLVKGGRSSSMEHLSSCPSLRPCSPSPSPTRRSQHPVHIQRTPSLQTLHPVLPLAQLRKASSVQSLERRTERSTILGEVQIPYGLARSPDSPQLELHRVFSVDDVLASRVGRPVGRVTQAFPDGTLLLELIRPPNGPFGFLISRGKGRPGTGVYVEKVGDGCSEGPYTGLLGVGDEILLVNGETVAGLSLEQVTRLMTKESTATLRIMPARRSLR